MDVARAAAFDFLAEELHAAFVGIIDTADAVEARRLAGAVWTDQRYDFSLRNVHGEAVDSGKLSKADGHIFNFKHWCAPPFLPAYVSGAVQIFSPRR